MNIQGPFILPELEFVGGATQTFVFHCYNETKAFPSELSSCSADFSITNFINKYGKPYVSIPMEVQAGKDSDSGMMNTLSVTLSPSDTVDLCGKYIYQITLRDVTGIVEIPGQGLIHINNNIHKGFLA